MVPTLSPLPVQPFKDNNGLPLAGGKLFLYAAGTTTKQNGYTDSTGSTSLPNPIILNARGEVAPSAASVSCGMWLDPTLSYKMVLAPATDSDPPSNPFWTVDQITLVPLVPLAPSFIAIGNIAALRAVTSAVPSLIYVSGYYSAGDGGEGFFAYVSTDTTSVDNGGTIIVDAAGHRWYRSTDGLPYSVKWFGAYGNNAANDTTSFTNCLTASAGNVYVPPGTYLLNGITIPASTVFLGAGPKTVLAPLAAGYTAGQFITLGGDGAEIGNFDVNLSATTHAGVPSIYGLNRDSVYIHDITLVQGGQFGVYLNGPTGPIIERVHVKASANVGIYVTGGSGVQTLKCSVTGNGGHGIQYSGTNGGVIDGCQVTGTPPGWFGIGLYGTSSCRIVNNNTLNTSSEGVNLTDCSQCILGYNQLAWDAGTSGDYGISVTTDASGFSNSNTVIGNTIVSSGKAGIAIVGTLTNGGHVGQYNLVIGNNVVDPNQLRGVGVDETCGIVVYGNSYGTTVTGNMVAGDSSVMAYGAAETSTLGGVAYNSRFGPNAVFGYGTGESVVTGSSSVILAW